MTTDRITMEDVAARAGVSRALVSIVFRGAAGASEATRERVLAAAVELDYRPDSRASRLGRSRTGTLGVIFSVGASFHGDLLQSLYTEADVAGYELVLSGVTAERSEAAAVETLLAERCEGLVLIGSTLATSHLARLGARLPVVSLLRAVNAESVDVVRTDDAAGLRLAVRHLLGLGHQHIALLDGGRAPGATERRRGYRSALRHAGGLRETIVPSGPTELEGAAAAMAVTRLPHPRPTAVAAFNDRCALGYVDAVRQLGLRVPDDVSVVGFDDISQAAYPHVALTTVRQDAGRLGAAAIEAVTTRLEADSRYSPPTASVSEPELVVRGSTSPPQRR